MARKKLTDNLVAGIYEYYHKDTNDIYYRGSSEKTLEGLDGFHRVGHTYEVFKSGQAKYSYTVFRSTLRRPLGEDLLVRWVIEPKDITREELLILEGKLIQEKQAVKQCILNHDPNPLRTFKKWNK